MSLFTDLDRRLLNRIQSDFPLTSRPFLTLARELNLTENDVLQRLQALKASGVIRRIGGNIVPAKLGYVSTLCAASVPDEQLEQFTAVVNSYAGVTHNYRRNHTMNVWFTFIAPSRADIEQHLAHISRLTGVSPILNLPATRLYKLRAQFDLSPPHSTSAHTSPPDGRSRESH